MQVKYVRLISKINKNKTDVIIFLYLVHNK